MMVTSNRLESTIERKLLEEVKAREGLCEKWTSGTLGWPDRIVILFDGKIGFVELKAPGKKPRSIQHYRHKQLRKLGFKVYVIDDVKSIKGVLDEIQSS